MADKKEKNKSTSSLRAEELAKEQKQVSVSEFFLKNRHLLGFDNPIKALSTTVKELVDNSLDACEEMRVLPEIIVQIKSVTENKFIISVEDNGPGIIKSQLANVFGRLLYGSKFFGNRQSRGQQGIGVSASILYSQLTTGKPARITSRIDPKHPAHYMELRINTAKNEPDVTTDKEIEWFNKSHGTKVEIELEGKYQKGKQSVDEYIKQSAISNPHAEFTYINPLNEKVTYRKATAQLPKQPKKIQPHPYGVELGALMQMMKVTKAKTISQFFTSEFCRVSPAVAHEILAKAQVAQETKPQETTHEQAERLFKSVQETKIMAPPTDCLSPIGENTLLAALKKEIDAEFYAAITRSPAVYRGIPFQIEAAIAYGGSLPKEELIRLIRFANRVPLQYQQSACAATRSAINTVWRNYGLGQSKGALPAGPVVLVLHLISVWVPFTSESKEALAHYPEIIKEIKLALQEVGRKLNGYIRKNVRAKEAKERISLFEKYIPEVADALADLSGKKKEPIILDLQKILKKGLPALIAEANGEKQDDKGKE
ncbi:MAG: DNA topoisomerase VI subunit B [Nanoarchaeota archaeon]|mgnify:FL=1